MVPVLDPAQLVGRAHPRAAGQVVVVLVDDGRLVGLLADEVRGLAAVRPSQTTQLTGAGADLLLRSAFEHPELGHVVSVIDPDVVLRLPGVPVVREAPATGDVAPAEQARRRPAPTRSPSCGAAGTCWRSASSTSTRRSPHPCSRPSVVDGPTCLGTTSVAGADVAVADLLALLELGALDGSPMACGLVLDLPDGQVVLGVSEMVGLRDVPDERVVPLPASASPSPQLLSQVADVEGVGACLLVDGARLRSSEAVTALSRVATASDDGTATDDAARTAGAVTGPPHLAYRAGVDLATPLEQVAEVLGFPDDLVRSSGAPAVLGFVLHRGEAVPVLCLATVLGREVPAYGVTSRLLLVHVDGAPVAWAVAALHAILPLVWHDPDAAARDGRPGGVLAASPLVELATRPGLLPLLDLQQLATTALGAAPARLPAQRAPAPARPACRPDRRRQRPAGTGSALGSARARCGDRCGRRAAAAPGSPAGGSRPPRARAAAARGRSPAPRRATRASRRAPGRAPRAAPAGSGAAPT